MFMTYKEKLQDPKWQRKRLRIFERDDWHCVSCKRNDKTLQVHHVVYAKKDPWDYADSLLQTLCSTCHAERQEISDRAANALRVAIKDFETPRMAVVAQRICDAAMEELE
jgi:5-methylcytosine-specific restriction endonuclease McrA